MMNDEDRQPLVDPEEGRGLRRFKWCWCVLGALLVIGLGHGGTVYWIYFKDYWTCPPSDCVPVRILSLNTWGMPESLGSKFKAQRMAAIRDEVSLADYDLYLLEELWMRPDYRTIRSGLPDGFHMTEYSALTHGKCDGEFGPDGCSGLAVISKWPILEVAFHMYADCGNPLKILVDGECLASKGVGRIRIRPEPLNVTLDVFVTHTVADPDPSHGYNNSYYRVKQVHQLVNQMLMTSSADAIVLGGDFNAAPEFTKGSPYQMIQDYMQNCIEDIYYHLRAWLDPQYATYANANNTFSRNIQAPVIYDYIFHRSQNKSKVRVWTNWFEMPFFKVPLKEANTSISYSDHEAVTTSLAIKQLS